MRFFLYLQPIGIFVGLLLIFLAARYKTEIHPVWYRAGLLSPFGGKKEWWHSSGYALQKTGALLFAVGIVSGAIYFGRFITSCF